jgi:hypothetical protein
MKVLVTGSRKFHDRDLVRDALAATELDILVHGKARGADFCAHIACVDFGMSEEARTIRCYPADWEAHGMAAGPKRNQLMIDQEHFIPGEPIDLFLAFPLPDSKGTWDMVKRCFVHAIPGELFSESAFDQQKFRRLKQLYWDSDIPF